MKSFGRGKIRIVCMGCGREGMHQTGGPIRLRDRGCSSCGNRGRPTWWVKKYPLRAIAEARPTALLRNRWLRATLERRIRELAPGTETSFDIRLGEDREQPELPGHTGG